MRARLFVLISELLETVEQVPPGLRRDALLVHIAKTRIERADAPLDRVFWQSVLHRQNDKIAKMSRDGSP